LAAGEGGAANTLPWLYAINDVDGGAGQVRTMMLPLLLLLLLLLQLPLLLLLRLLVLTHAQQAEFGFWLNNPGMGNVTFNAITKCSRSMTWRMHTAAYLDYIVVAPSEKAMKSTASRSFELLERFTSWVGRR